MADFSDIDAEIKMLMRSKSTVSVDLPNKSALDWKIEKKLEIHEEEERKSLLHRLVVISKLHHNNFDQIGVHYDKFFREKQSLFGCEAASGLLLLYPKHSVHVIESCNEMLVALAKELLDEQTEPVNTQKSKILISSHDIPNRLYQNWSYRIIDIEAPNLSDFDPGEAAEKLVQDMLIQLLYLGSFLSKNAKPSTKATDTLHEKVPEHMPQQTVVGYLLENDNRDTDCVMKVEEYVKLYETPYDVVLESEYSWPMPIKLFPYN